MTSLERVLAVYKQCALMVGIPYVYGGAHGVTDFRDHSVWCRGVDCSSGASIALSAGGILAVPRADYALDTEEFEAWGAPGEGNWLTVWVYDGMLSGLDVHHCVLDFHNSALWAHQWWQAANSKTGVGWIGFDPANYRPRHWEGT